MKKMLLILMCFLPVMLGSQTITDLGVDGQYFDIKGDNNGTIHILWIDNGVAKYGQIVNRAVVNQETISVIGSREINFRKFRPRLSVKPDGTAVHFVWVSPNAVNSNSLIHCWRNAAGTWAKQTIYTSTNYLQYPSVCVDGSGVVHAACIEWKYSSDKHPVFYWRKVVGAGWVKQINLAPTDAKHLWVNLYTDSSGNVHVTWDRNKNSIKYRYAASGGNLASSTTVHLPTKYARHKQSDIYVDPSGNVHIAALGYDDPGIWINQDYWVKPAGGSFSAAVDVNLSPIGQIENYMCFPAVAASSLDMVAVAWGHAKYHSNPFTVNVALYDGSTWTNTTLDTTADFQQDTRPAMALDSENAYLLWRGSDGSIILATIAYTTPTAIISPNGGELLELGKIYDVTWNPGNITGNVDINLYKNGVKQGALISGISNSGSWTWNISKLADATAIVAGSDYQIEVEGLDDSGAVVSDMSDAVFTIYKLAADSLVVDYGADLGLFLYSLTNNWQQMSGLNPAVMTQIDIDGDGLLEMAVGVEGNGLHLYDASTGWTKISEYVPEVMISCGDYLVCDFGSLALHAYNQSLGWVKLSGFDPGLIAAVDFNNDGTYKLAAVFPGYGLYILNLESGWTKINSLVPQAMTAYGNYLAVDFGTAGLWRYHDSGGWLRLSALNPDIMQSVDFDNDRTNELAVGFDGLGLYYYDNAEGWSSRINSIIPEALYSCNMVLVCDFGTANGLFAYHNSDGWFQLSPLDPGKMESVDFDSDGTFELSVFFPGYGLYYYDYSEGWSKQLNDWLPEAMSGINN